MGGEGVGWGQGRAGREEGGGLHLLIPRLFYFRHKRSRTNTYIQYGTST